MGRGRTGRAKYVSEKMARYVDDLDELRGIISLLQSQGKLVVFTNGSFDLLHVGHARCLKDAKSRGNFLVIGVNTDESIKEYKDPALPVMPFEERVEMLGAFSFVDYITPIADPTADRVLEILKPDVYAKGTDYTPDNVPERDTARKVGAEIMIVGDPKDHSSRDVISRILAMKDKPGATKGRKTASKKAKVAKKKPAAAAKKKKPATKAKTAVKKKASTTSESSGSNVKKKTTTTKSKAAPKGKPKPARKSTVSSAK